MNVERLESGAVTVLRLTGELNEEGVDQLRLTLTRCLQDQRSRVVVNMAEVCYVSYLGLGLLVERLRQFRAYRGDLRLANVNLFTSRLMRMVGVLHLFEIFDSEVKALESFRQAA